MTGSGSDCLPLGCCGPVTASSLAIARWRIYRLLEASPYVCGDQS